MLATLKEILQEMDQRGKAVAAFNVYGYEDAKAVVLAAEALKCPVVLMANRVAVSHMNVRLMGVIMNEAAKAVSVSVGVHLDHAVDNRTIEEAICSGFYTSVMFDGSQLPYEKNVEITSKVVSLAHENGISVEAEIGSVGYSDPSVQAASRYTEPDEAKKFAKATQTDCLAVAVGTVHRMEYQGAVLQFDRLKEIRKAADVPLVIHGSTGVSDEDLCRLVDCGARKINIGTALRMGFGKQLRSQMEENPAAFDRITLFARCMQAVQAKAEEKIRLITL